jgi:hypothetical protein
VVAIIQSCPNLRHLYITQCGYISGDIVTAVAKHCANLESLVVMQIREHFATDHELRALAKGCPQLRTLVLSRSDRITDVGVCALVQGCRDLRMLTLSSGSITNRALVAIAEHCPNLTDLSLHGCLEVTDTGLTAIGCACRKLFYLSVCGSAITSAGVRAVAAHRPKSLKVLHLAHSTVEELEVPLELFPGRIDVEMGCYCLRPHYSHPIEWWH